MGGLTAPDARAEDEADAVEAYAVEADAVETVADAPADSDDPQAVATAVAPAAAEADETAMPVDGEAAADPHGSGETAEIAASAQTTEGVEAAQADDVNEADVPFEPDLSRLRSALAKLDEAFEQPPAKAAAG
jgi:ATP-dependent RNA helicase SUPV3L1/SUV3